MHFTLNIVVETFEKHTLAVTAQTKNYVCQAILSATFVQVGQM